MEGEKKLNLASAETLFSPAQKSIDELKGTINLEQFKRLDEEAMYNEIQKILPILGPFASNFASVQESLVDAREKLEQLEIMMNPGARGNIIFSNAEDDMESMLSIPEHQVPDPFIIKKSRLLNKRVILNVGGVRHEVLWKILEQLPFSRLGLLSKAQTHVEILSLCSDYNLVDNEYFFDRHPRSFNTILNFYRTGKLHLTDEMCVLAFGDDLFYWMIDETLFDSCCLDKFIDKRELVITEMEDTSAQLERDDEEDFGTGKFSKYQKCIWDLMEKSESSKAAQVISVISMVFVAVSIVGMVISTVPALQIEDTNGNLIENPLLNMVETICIAWFTLEYFLRMAGAPNKWAFLKDGLNVVDVISILPFFVSLFFLSDPAMTKADPGGATPTDDPEDAGGSLDDVLQVFRIFKLARVLKLARHSPGLQAIAYTLQHSYKELALLIFLMCISGIIIGSLAYFIEIDNDSGFTSIPTAFYWVVITMTTVGYGDISPSSGLGKLVGTICAVSGVLVLSLPIPIIAQNFEKFHKNQQKKDQAEKSKKKRAAAKKKEFEERLAACQEPMNELKFTI